MACLFCRIARKEVPTTMVYEDDQVVAFRDTNPQAPVHVLVIPRDHVASLADATADHEPLLGRLFTAAAKIARAEGIDASGYRAVVNTGPQAGQTVFHVHLHLLGGRTLTWPPG